MSAKIDTKPRLDKFALEVRYEYGEIYLDRCGQTIVDISRRYPGWVVNDASPKNAQIENFDNNYIVTFNNKSFSFTADEISQKEIDDITNDCYRIWKIVQGNLNLDTYFRIGCRIFYIIPTSSTEESEKLIQKSKFNLRLPDNIESAGYNRTVQHLIVVLEGKTANYRLELKGITRMYARAPSHLEMSDPKDLPRNQRNAQIALLKSKQAYRKDPMYAVEFDVDAFQRDPETIDVKTFIKEQAEIIHRDFYPIVGLI